MVRLGSWGCACVALSITIALINIARAHAQPPNIILITADDLGVQLSSYGDHTIETPNIDRIATEGVRFTNAYITQSSCSSSRSSIFTGSYPHQNGQIGLAHHGFSMSEAFPTIPKILRSVGYRTGVIGKVHVNPDTAFSWTSRSPHLQWEWGTREVKKVADAAKIFFKGGGPFFLKVSYLDPHAPLINQVLGLPSQPIISSAITTNTWTKKPVPADKKATIAAYYNCIKRMDIGVGMLLQALEESAGPAAANNTMIIFLGDNGGGPVQQGKMDIYENGLRVPFLIRFPNVGKPLQERPELVSAVDILPTILAAAEVTGDRVPRITREMMTEGQSLLPLVRGETVVWRRYLFAEMNYHSRDLYRPSRSVRDVEGYKLIHTYPPLKRGINGWQLFNLHTDPFEKTNLAGSSDLRVRAIHDRLMRELTAWQTRTGDTY